MAPKKAKAKGAEPAESSATAAAAAGKADDKKQTKDKSGAAPQTAAAKDKGPQPWPAQPVAGPTNKAEDVGAAEAKADAGAKAKPVAATAPMKVGDKKAKASAEPANDIKEEEVDKIKLESAMRRRKELEAGTKAASGPAFKIDADVSRKQREKQREWLASTDRELEEIRDRTKKETEKNSDLALKVVLAVWLLIVFGIFFHVWRTIEQGNGSSKAAVRNPATADGSWSRSV